MRMCFSKVLTVGSYALSTHPGDKCDDDDQAKMRFLKSAHLYSIQQYLLIPLPYYCITAISYALASY